MTRILPVAERTLQQGGLDYYDTAGLRLRRHGLMLTRCGDCWQLDRGDGRICQLTAVEPDRVPDELRRLVRAYSRDLELVPVPGPAIERVRSVCPTARDVVLDYLEAQSAALARADLAVRLDEPEGVHDLRVAARRIRATLRTFAPVLGGRRLVRNLCGSLRWLGESVGPARDTEVQRERLRRRLDPVPLVAQQHFEAAARQASAECGEALDSHRYLQLLNALEILDSVLRDQPRHDRPKAARRPAAAVLPSLVWTVAAETDARVRAASRDRGPDAVHSVRKSVKRLRYALEAAEDALPFALQGVLADCRTLQDLLGEHQDAVVAGEWLRSMSARAAEPIPAFEALADAEKNAAVRCAAALPSAWDSVLQGLEPLRDR
ncbi:MAG TPA: CHAD domain-containing protein [Amycolatopsis sp.]|nr:CHAD domain-containing protein [Amycolatopsis sp.]